jgi:hypothetical protein
MDVDFQLHRLVLLAPDADIFSMKNCCHCSRRMPQQRLSLSRVCVITMSNLFMHPLWERGEFNHKKYKFDKCLLRFNQFHSMSMRLASMKNFHNKNHFSLAHINEQMHRIHYPHGLNAPRGGE